MMSVLPSWMALASRLRRLFLQSAPSKWVKHQLFSDELSGILRVRQAGAGKRRAST
jgi:hypothetical protein